MPQPVARLSTNEGPLADLQLLEAAGIGVLLWHREASETEVSPQCWALLGEDAARAGTFADWCARMQCGEPPTRWAGVESLVDRLGDAPLAVDLRALDRAGRRVELALQLKVCARDAAGQPEQVRALVCGKRGLAATPGTPPWLLGTAGPLPAGAESEQQLRADRSFQELVLSTMEDILFVKDEAFVIVQANAAFLELYPESVRDSVIGSTTLEAYDEAQREEFLQEDRRAFVEGFSEVQETIFFPNGQQRTLWTKKLRFEDHAGRRYILAYARDITELKETERALMTANSELEEFAYRVSHDLRSPLQSSVHLLGYLQAVLQDGNVKEAQQILGTVQKSLGGLDEMARDVLDIHRIRRGELVPESIDIKDRIERIFERLRPGNDDVALAAQFQIEAVPIVDSYGLNLVLENLISNAIKYRDSNRSDSKVLVTVRCDTRYLRVWVEDNGLGIPEDNRDKIFGMFQRFHPRNGFGSGLGLYMTRQWAERMGGDANVEHLEQGTRFAVRIPQRQLSATG